MPPLPKRNNVEKPTEPAVESETVPFARPVVYEKRELGIVTITDESARKMLGWQEFSEKPSSYLLVDNNGKYIHCHYNPKNRPYDWAHAKTLESEILKGHWKLNGANNIVLGTHGIVTNGQHRLIALVLASQEWAKNPERWPHWKTEPILETTVALGFPEDDDTVNTIDTGKERTFADVIFRSEIFSTYPPKPRLQLSRMADYAIRLLWHRTGAYIDAFAPRRTHSDGIAFWDTHPHIGEAIKHIYEENQPEKGKKIEKIAPYISLGYASGFLYLMGCSRSPLSDYLALEPKGENPLDWSLWDKACEFWTEFAANAESIQACRWALAKRVGGEKDEQDRLKFPDRCWIIAKSWRQYVVGETVDPGSIQLQYANDERGIPRLTETPTVGGIDRGDPTEDEQTDEEAVEATPPEEIAERAKEEREKRGKKTAPKTTPTQKPPTKPKELKRSV